MDVACPICGIDYDEETLTELAIQIDATLAADDLERMIADLERKERAEPWPSAGWVSLDEIVGPTMIPIEAAEVIREAIEKAIRAGDVTAEHRWRFLELMAAEYLASA